MHMNMRPIVKSRDLYVHTRRNMVNGVMLCTRIQTTPSLHAFLCKVDQAYYAANR